MKFYDNFINDYLFHFFQIDWGKFISKAFDKIDKKVDSKEEVVVYAKEFLSKLTVLIKNITASEQGNT